MYPDVLEGKNWTSQQARNMHLSRQRPELCSIPSAICHLSKIRLVTCVCFDTWPERSCDLLKKSCDWAAWYAVESSCFLDLVVVACGLLPGIKEVVRELLAAICVVNFDSSAAVSRDWSRRRKSSWHLLPGASRQDREDAKRTGTVVTTECSHRPRGQGCGRGHLALGPSDYYTKK